MLRELTGLDAVRAGQLFELAGHDLANLATTWRSRSSSMLSSQICSTTRRAPSCLLPSPPESPLQQHLGQMLLGHLGRVLLPPRTSICAAPPRWRGARRRRRSGAGGSSSSSTARHRRMPMRGNCVPSYGWLGSNESALRQWELHAARRRSGQSRNARSRRSAAAARSSARPKGLPFAASRVVTVLIDGATPPGTAGI